MQKFCKQKKMSEQFYLWQRPPLGDDAVHWCFLEMSFLKTSRPIQGHHQYRSFKIAISSTTSWLNLCLGPWNHETRSVESMPCELPPLHRPISNSCDWLSQLQKTTSVQNYLLKPVFKCSYIYKTFLLIELRNWTSSVLPDNSAPHDMMQDRIGFEFFCVNGTYIKSVPIVSWQQCPAGGQCPR